MSATPPYPYELRYAQDRKSVETWQDGWRSGWAQGATDEAEARKIKTPKLNELASIITVLDQWDNEAVALQFMRRVYFPSRWDTARHKVSRYWQRFCRTTKV